MRNGYEVIMVSESENTTPDRKFRFDDKKKKMVVVIAVLLFMIVGVFYSQRRHHQQQIPEVVVVPPEEQTAVMVRPGCVSYTRRITILQTSMATPDHQWAPIACEDSKNQVVELNSFGLPDAILQTNLSHTVFEHSKIKGFGGAFTEAAALNFNQLSIKGKETLMELLFGKSGLGYTLGRLPLNSCKQIHSFDASNVSFSLQPFVQTRWQSAFL